MSNTLAKANSALLIAVCVAVAPISAMANDPLQTSQPILVAQGQAGQGQNQGGNENQNQNNNQNNNQNQTQNQNQNRNAGQGDGMHTRMMTRAEAAAGDGLYACFFADANLSGDAFCIGRQASFEQLSPRWNDQISSIEVVGDFSVKLCTDAAFGGNCATHAATVEALPAEFDNAVSSLAAE